VKPSCPLWFVRTNRIAHCRQTLIAVSIPQNRRTDDLVEVFHISDALKWRSTLLCLLISPSERVGCFNAVVHLAAF